MTELPIARNTEEIAVLYHRRCLIATEWIESHPVALAGRAQWLDYRRQLMVLPQKAEWPQKVSWPEPPRQARLCGGTC